jgi:Protein of unknown function (DUF1761)
MPTVNFLAVLVTGIAIFMLGGLWYSPVMFAKPWIRLQGKSMEEMAGRAKPIQYVQVFICGLLVAWAMAMLLSHFSSPSIMTGVHAALLAWLGFTGATSYGTALFSFRPKALWLIDSGFNLVSMILAGVILSVWR